MSYPDPRTVFRALVVLERLPIEALADLTERLIDRLDASQADPDLEEETDWCGADDAPLWLGRDHGPGDPDDAERNGDDEPDADDDRDEPLVVGGGPYRPERRRPVGLRPEQEGLVQVWRRSTREYISRGMAPLPMEQSRPEGRIRG